VAGGDQGYLAGQVVRGEVDAGGDPGAGGVLSQQRRRSVVVLDPGLARQILNAHRAGPGLRMAHGQHDDHLVHPQEPAVDARMVG
jgi:hypothetical protein